MSFQLPGVNLRGVYLATLLMQGFETASLANDACGVPLPWLSTSPWLVFDGKLFQLKLKMTDCVQTLHELCDDHLETVLKIERLKQAILEDAEHFLLPATIRNQLYLGGGNAVVAKDNYFNYVPFLPTTAGGAGSSAGGGGGGGLLGQNAPGAGSYFGHLNAAGLRGGLQFGGHNNHNNQNNKNNNRSALNNRNPIGPPGGNNNNNNLNQLLRQGLGGGGGQYQQQQQQSKGPGHQLKVGGVVVGSWGSGYRAPPPQMTNLSTRYNQVGRGRNATQMLTNRLNRMPLDMLPQIAQFPPQHYGQAAAALNRAFNVRSLYAGGLGAGLGGGYGGGVLSKQMKAGGGGVGGGGVKRGKNVKQANLKKQNAKKKNKAKKEGAGAKKAVAGEEKTNIKTAADSVSAIAEELKKNLVIGEGNDNEMENG